VIKADGERLKERILSMNEIGRDPEGGVTRLALTDADREGRDRLVEWMKHLGLAVRVDDVGNIYGRRSGLQDDAPPVMVGSHVDTVPQGGLFDGTLGVMAALELVEALNDAGIETHRPVEVASFTNEEGSRFEPSIMGSGVLTGVFSLEYVESRPARDDGALLGAELKRIGYKGRPENRPGPLKAFLEYHVEQGPVLEREGLRCGIAERVVGFSWWNAVMTGQTDHSGPTPMDTRRDALVAAARAIASLRDLARWYGEDMVATVGRMQLEPNIINAVPGRATFSLDVRAPDDDTVAAAAAAARRMVETVAAQEQVDVSMEEIKTIPAVEFDPRLVDLAFGVAEELGIPCRRMASGAGHDAQYMAGVAPTVLIFTRSRGGKSHSPEEWTDWEDVAAGADILLQTALQLAQEEEG
jgi:beta-ureidopropionase / N-carbamoyl-L-amino-acid hydrolase